MLIRKILSTRLGAAKTPLVAALVLLSWTCQGCAVVPVPQFPGNYKTNITKEDSEFVLTGQTRLEEVQQNLGNPDYRLHDDSRWVYVAKSHTAGKVRVCGGVVNPIDLMIALDDPSYSNDVQAAGGCTDKSRNRVITFLEITFDDSGVVSERLSSTVKNGRCQKSNLCRDENGIVYFRVDGTKVMPQPHERQLAAASN